MGQSWTKAHDASKNTHWINFPSTDSPIVDDELNRNEVSVDTIDDRVITLDTIKAEQSDLLVTYKNVSFNSSTGTFTFTKWNNTTTTIDTDIEKIAINFDYDDDPTSAHYQQLVIQLDDGTVKYVDLSALITEYEFADTTTIHFSVANDGTISANVIDGSITESKLQPNFLADCRSARTGAETAEADAIAKALVSEGWAVGRQNGTLVGSDSPYYHNNAQYYKDQAQQIAAQSIGGLSDVDIDLQTLEDKQILQFNESTGNWENTPLTNDLNYEGVGNPIEFNAPKGGVATKAEIKFSPIQDLNGYTSPWVGGSGKNKCSEKIINSTTAQYVKVLMVNLNPELQPNTTYTISFVGTRGNRIYPNESLFTSSAGFDVTGSRQSVTVTTVSTLDKTNEQQYVSGGWAFFKNSLSQSNANVFDDLQIELGSTASPYEPYENICPISGYSSGWTGGQGKNKLENNVTSKTIDSSVTVTKNADGSLTINGTKSGQGFISFNMQTDSTTSASQNDETKHIPNGDYILSGSATGLNLQVAVADSSGTSTVDVIRSGDGTFTIDDTHPYNYTRLLIADGTYNNVKIFPMIRPQGTDATYEPYANTNPNTLDLYLDTSVTEPSAETYTANLGTSIYYGGSYNFTTGKLVVDKGITNLGTLTWSKSTNAEYPYFTSSVISGIQITEQTDIICSQYTAAHVVTAGSDLGFFLLTDTNRLRIRDANFYEKDATVFTRAMNGVQIVYPLATPTEISVTPETIDLLIGKNVLWTDGDMIFFNASLMIDSNRVTYEDTTVEEALDSVTKFRTFNVATTAWVANTGSTSSDYPYIAEITSTYYNANSTPIWQMNGVGTIPTSTERSGINLVQEAVFGASGITLYASAAPSVALVLEVKGE